MIGASAGIGAALARELDRRGVHLILSARTTGGLESIASELEGRPKILPLDVCDLDAAKAAAFRASHADGIIYCAGDYAPMTAIASPSCWLLSVSEPAKKTVGRLGFASAVLAGPAKGTFDQSQGTTKSSGNPRASTKDRDALRL